MNRRFLVLCLSVSAAGMGFLGWVFYQRLAVNREFHQQAQLAAKEAQEARLRVEISSTQKISAGASFFAAVEQLGLDSAAAAKVVSAVQPLFDPRHIRAGNTLVMRRTVAGELRSIHYQIDADRMLWILPRGDEFRAEVDQIPSKTELVPVSGAIQDSLFRAVLDAGEKPELAMRLAEIFGWDLDFYTDPRLGDTFRILVEKKEYGDGTSVSYGKIYAAEYINGRRPYRAVMFHDASGRAAYYAPDGSSLQKAFLHSPLKFSAHITSHFTHDRFHPILKVHREHLGIDYAAPTGTPVQSIGSGRVIFAGRKGGAGNLVQVQHANGYETMYLHLSKILVRNWQHVDQGQQIGLVGSTGLATGPHLDFRILQRGTYLNFERLTLPPAEPVAKANWTEFVAAREKWLPLLTSAGLADRKPGAGGDD